VGKDEGDTYRVEAGGIMSYEDTANVVSLRETHFYEGGTVEVTEPGSIYGRIGRGASFNPIFDITVGDPIESVTILRVIPEPSSEIEVFFSDVTPSDTNYIYWEIAKFDIVEDELVKTRQVLTHNPTLWSIIEPPE
jgi:hypothetical protein